MEKPRLNHIRQNRIVNAIQSARSEVRWRPGSPARRLLKRKLRGHLPARATSDDCQRVILTALRDDRAQVYVYWHDGTPYVALVAVVQPRHWLVTLTMEGLIESAYVVERPNRYLHKPVFELIGSLSEVLL